MTRASRPCRCVCPSSREGAFLILKWRFDNAERRDSIPTSKERLMVVGLNIIRIAIARQRFRA